jgi:arylsulfatase A
MQDSLKTIATIIAVLFWMAAHSSAVERPNVVLILCDDLGYGDVAANNPDSKIPTPNMDRIAREGIRFTDAHTPSSVCTPTRYGLLTGRYNWRSKLQSGVLGGLSPRLIEPERETLASMLKKQGYFTAIIGKWHLGMDWVKNESKEVNVLSVEKADQVNNVDYSKPIANGPNSVGFDYYFGVSASLDMVPYTFIENDHVTAEPTVSKTWPMYPGHPGETRKGPAAPEFEVCDVLPNFSKKAVETIHARAKSPAPFFLYLPLTSPHTPIAPTKEWIGKSGIGLYGDFVMQTDFVIGEILKALDRSDTAHNTLVIFTSDNGCSPAARIDELRERKHLPNGPLRGNKADLFDGGHRVPFIARWPARLTPTVSNQLVCLTDIFATLAEVVGYEIPDHSAEDSFSFLPDLLNEGHSKRDSIVHHSISGRFAIRHGEWKLSLCPGSGGWSSPSDAEAVKQNLPPAQLYKIAGGDLSETTNLIDQNQSTTERLKELLNLIVANGRSTPGIPQKNAVQVILEKPIATATKKSK